MRTWKSKHFGDNRMNFHGWIFAGLFHIGVSLTFVIWALKLGASRSSSGLMLLAVWILVLGQFGVALQNYCARAVRKIE